GSDRHRRCGGTGGVVPVNSPVAGLKGLAVMPLHGLLEFPGDRQAVGGDAAVFAAWDLRRQQREKFPVWVPTRQRLVENARSVLVLGPHGEMRVEQRGALPPEHLERPAAATLGGLILELVLRARNAAIVEHRICHRRRKSERDHPRNEGTARQLASFHIPDQTSQRLFVHARYSLRADPERPVLPLRSLDQSQPAEQVCLERSTSPPVGGRLAKRAV